ncbi:hypothetical protein [Streptomyces doebereineriae]|uniref:Uncharacterized protein n=1 Tax=Streptomyces doebereineriae TaxID=3075528 RepID=A0ABU2VNR8_9ACTN|nr:hypothetical protein [Streptomyces sp. DSM 41640]MDT0487202.1 hypothetical protein [Streptomyces sp. DSM 41640]
MHRQLPTERTRMEFCFHVTLVDDATATFSEVGMEAAGPNGPMYTHAILSTGSVIDLLAQAIVSV